MDLQEKIKLRDKMRDAIKMQEEVVSDCSRKMNLCRDCARMLEEDGDRWESRRDRESDRLEDMEAEYERLSYEIHKEGTAKYGTFSEAFNSAKYFGELKAMADSIPFA